MKLNLIMTGILCLLLITKTIAQTPDSTVTISAATDSYQFAYNAASASVQIKQKQTTTYTASVFMANIPVAETFNNQVSITNVECKVDSRTPKDFKPLYQYYSRDDIFYSDAQICYFPLTIPKKGTSAVVTFEQLIKDPRYFTTIDLSAPYAITHKEVNIKIPRWMKVEFKEYNFDGFNIKKSSAYLSSEDADLITYTIDKLPATAIENNSPGPSYIYPHLLVMCRSAKPADEEFTYFNTLDDQYKWYRSLTTNTVTDQAAIAAKAKELTAGAQTDIAKIKAVFYYVQDNIRYIAFEDGLAGFKPEMADEVLRKKYGDCKGMANLTTSLLTALGFEAKLCWLGTNHLVYDYQTPCLGVDNHMICALTWQNKTYFLDATESYLGFNEYAERIQGRQVLMANGDKYVLTRVPVAGIGQNIHTETAKLSIADNAFSGSVDHVWTGEDKEGVLTGLNSIKKEKTEVAMMKFLADADPDYKISDMVLSGTTDPDKDMKASYQVKYKDGLSAFGKEYYIDLDRKKELRDASIKINERKHDFWFGHKMNLTVKNELTIPPGYKVATLPPALNITDADYEFHIQYADAPGKITYVKNIIIKNTHLTKANFTKWNKAIEQLTQAYNESVILKPVSE